MKTVKDLKVGDVLYVIDGLKEPTTITIIGIEESKMVTIASVKKVIVYRLSNYMRAFGKPNHPYISYLGEGRTVVQCYIEKETAKERYDFLISKLNNYKEEIDKL